MAGSSEAIMQKSAILRCPSAGMDDDVAYQNVSVLHCLGEIPLANTPTQTAHTLGLTAMGNGGAASLGEKQWKLGGSWLCLPYMTDTVTVLHVGC